ncbi:RNA 2',3'-cyclic phosphodiesterase [Butyrivibrio sp. WCD3002]|jgi:2'-5' RNA ligase|uniref:RNA 2',3'-cyclic phosphodiesterase n=1 Tax=Butyrivibrio sp. WCD3002 TaxID=1280676 RepID=UPI0004224AB6|nr:RNA 2',3'-cyclic phosphodiesterase [Butyrivibrio sp. WCD3002]
MRLFIAINFEEDFRDALIDIQDELMRCGVDGNYTAPENLHMTLAFIGEWDDPEGVLEVVKSVPMKSFSIALKGYAPFKDMIFADIEENENLKAYVKRLRAALTENEIPFDRKKFLPHITLVRKAHRIKGAPLPEFDEAETMRVKGISLMKSERGSHGMIYTEIGYAIAF